jgi:hypothetical protein
MSIESKVDGSPVGDDGSRHDPLRPLPEGARARILEYSLDRLVLLVPAGSSRMSRQGGFGLLAMNASFVGGMAYWTSQVIAFGQRGFILFVLAAFAVFLGGFSSVILVIWLRLRFTEMWLLVEPSRIAVKRTLFGRSRLKTYDADPETVATFTRNWQVSDAESEEKRRICVRCGRKKIEFGDVLSLQEKQWILDAINRVLSGDDPQLRSLVLRDGAFEFVPDDTAPEAAGGQVRVEQLDADGLALEVTARPRTALRRASWLLMLVLSGLAGLGILANLFMRWWGGGILSTLALSAFPLAFAGIFFWTSAELLFVTTRITVDRERLTRTRTGTPFGRHKSIPTSSVTEVVVRTKEDPRGRRDGKAYWRLPDLGPDCVVRTANGKLELTFLHQTQDVLQIAGLVEIQLRRFKPPAPE